MHDGGELAGDAVSPRARHGRVDAAVGAAGERAAGRQHRGAAGQCFADFDPRHRKGVDREGRVRIILLAIRKMRQPHDRKPVSGECVERDGAAQQRVDPEIGAQVIDFGERTIGVGDDDPVGGEVERRPAGYRPYRDDDAVGAGSLRDDAGERCAAG